MKDLKRVFVVYDRNGSLHWPKYCYVKEGYAKRACPKGGRVVEFDLTNPTISHLG